MPPVDIFQTAEHELVLKAELPDMAREDIDINIENFVLTVHGEKKVANEVKDEQCPPRRAALRHVQPLVLAAADRRPQPGLRRDKNGVLTMPAAAA